MSKLRLFQSLLDNFAKKDELCKVICSQSMCARRDSVNVKIGLADYHSPPA